MNLVQINERLKDLPTPIVRQYANGTNPEVPAYLALADLQRRERVEKQMANAQGAAQGPMPSVKDQIEQKAGLMAAQGLQQQQMMQQMAQQRVPGPVPAGMPQPEDQPEAMARGGLTRAPVSFNFQHGGIVAFSNGGGARVHPQAELIEFLKKMGLTPEEFTKAPPKVQNEIRDMMRAGVQAATPTPPSAAPTAQAAKSNLFRSINPAGVAGYGFGLYHGDLGAGEDAELERRRQMPPTLSDPEVRAAENRTALNNADAALRSAAPAPKAPEPIADLKALAEQNRRQQTPRPAPTSAPTATTPAVTPTTAPAPESMEAMFRTQMTKEPKARTRGELIAEQKALREAAGLTEPAGLAQMERIRKLQEQYEGTKPSALDDLIRVFGQAGQYKGLSGLAPAYTANQQQKRAADLEMAKKINEMMSGVETTQRGEMKDIASGALAGLATDRAAGVDFTKSLLSTLGPAYTAETNRKTQERGQDIQKEVALINARANAAGRPFNVVETQFNLLKTGDPKKDAALLQTLSAQYAEGRKPGLDMELLKKFEALPGVKTDLETLSALRMIGSPKPETVTRIRQIESRLAAKAKQNGMDPAKIGVSDATPVESVGAPPPGAVREVKK